MISYRDAEFTAVFCDIVGVVSAELWTPHLAFRDASDNIVQTT